MLVGSDVIALVTLPAWPQLESDRVLTVFRNLFGYSTPRMESHEVRWADLSSKQSTSGNVQTFRLIFKCTSLVINVLLHGYCFFFNIGIKFCQFYSRTEDAFKVSKDLKGFPYALSVIWKTIMMN